MSKKNHRTVKMVESILITVTLFIIIFSISIYLKQKQNQKNKFREIGNSITAQTASALKYWIDDQIRVVKTIASDKRVIDACLNPTDNQKLKKANDYLMEIHKRYPYYENLPLSIRLDKDIIRDVNGKKVTIKNGTFLIDTVGGVTVGKGGMNYSYVKEAFKGKEYFISEIYPSILRGNPIFVISAPIKYNNKIIGAAMISPKIDYFAEKFIKSVKLGKTGYMCFIDGRGLIIAHKNREYILSTSDELNKINKHIIKRVLNNETDFEETYLGEKKHYVSTKVQINKNNLKYEWYLVFSQNNTEIFQDTMNLLKLIIIMILIIVIFITVVVYIIIDINQKEIYEENLIVMNKSLEKKVQERTKELQERVIRDSLTKLLNHKASYNYLEKEINDCRKTLNPISIIMLDLDYFKRINDTYGHQAGDEVLVSVSRAITNNITERDIAGRYGGEEFIIILPNRYINQAIVIAERIKTSISQLEFNYEGLKVTASMGVSSWRGENAVEFINKADNLLYRAKLNGRNRIES